MITSPGEELTYITFPGVIMHQTSHKLMRDYLRAPLYNIDYFPTEEIQINQFHHYETGTIRHNLLICFSPLIFNSLFCVLFTLPLNSIITITKEGENLDFSMMLLWWVGISMGMHAFPSNDDIYNALSTEEKKDCNSLIRFLYSTTKLFNDSKWARFFYALFLGYLFPILIFGCNF